MVSNNKIIVIMGVTGTGKSRLSIDLATRFFPSEIINSDKMQVYRGLDITTNKIPEEQRLGVPHHLLGEFDSEDGELTQSEFRKLASKAIENIATRNKLPLIVGGSNSFIHALVSNSESSNESESSEFEFDSVCTSELLRYRCCFLWIDVTLPVLYEYLVRRVDDMFDSGMLDELSEFYNSGEGGELTRRVGIKKAIGVAELTRYFRCNSPRSCSASVGDGEGMDVVGERMLFEEAVENIKCNTCKLAKRQLGKIQRLRSAGWDLHRVNATEVFREALLCDSGMSREMWERDIVKPSAKIVKRFLES
ncbi:hypothetical protein GIB67_012667 [Kingdonia uniflora]|uniref:Adenylate isopentenyltransferase n=1 Tax=Kingdonia uniflora TaxID=39325 RepID=A0A7J7NFJ5_9MAGN|nr:hypothetical protein GIB67_012667 [Kingdonia uniflora]